MTRSKETGRQRKSWSAVPSGLGKSEFMGWIKKNPEKCLFCEEDGHRHYNCKKVSGNQKYSRGHPFSKTGLPAECKKALERRGNIHTLHEVWYLPEKCKMKCVYTAPGVLHCLW